MRKKLGLGVSLLSMCASCLPARDTIHNRDTVIETYDIDSSRKPAEHEVKVETTSTALTLTLERVVRCEREQRQKVQRWRDHEVKSVSGVVHVAMYVLGLTGAGVGSYMIYENATVDDPDDRAIQIGDDVQQGRNFGIAFAAIGGVILLSALGTSIKTADTSEFAGRVEVPVEGSLHAAECERRPAASESIGLVFATDGTARVYVPVGQTDSRGTVTASWASITAHLPANVKAEAAVVAGSRESVDAQLVQNDRVRSLATVVVPLTEDPEQQWTTAVQLDTPEGYRAFRAKFPTSPHATEADERAKLASTRIAQQELDAAIAAEDVEKGAQALAALRTYADAATMANAQERYDRMRTAKRVKTFASRLPELLSAIEQAEDPSLPLATAKAAVDEVRSADAELAARADVQITNARDQAVSRLVRQGQEAAEKRDFATSTKRFGTATTITTDVPAVEKARKLALDKAVRVGHAEARALARQKKFDEAIALVEILIPVAARPKPLETDRNSWEAAANRLAASEAERTAREDRRRQAAEAREAAAQAARDRAAAEAQARYEQKQREEADRKAREEAARQAAEQRRVDQAAKKAEQAAQEAARQEAARRAAEDAKRAAEEAKRREAAEKMEQQLAKQQKASGPPTVQFEMPARFINDDVLKRLPVPASCKATTKSYFAKSTTCANCAARSMTQVEMTCGTLALTFVRDQQNIWVTCTKEQSCGDCLEAGRSALSAFIDGKEKIKVVQGCPKQP